MDINATLIGQLITFAILVWFTMKYVWPPITKAIRDREKKIADGLAAAERSQRELITAEEKATALIKEAKQEAAHLIDQAHKRAASLVEAAKQQGREEGERLIALAKEELAKEVNQTKEALRKQLASLAVLGAEKILKQHLDVKSQTALLNEFVTEL